MADLSPEQLESLKGRDQRLRVLDLAIAVENELRDSRTLALVLAQAREEANEALERLATVNPTDLVEIIRLQAVVYRARFIGATINTVLDQGRMAERSITDEGIDASDM